MIIIMRTGCGSSAVKTPLILVQTVSGHLTSMILTKSSTMSVHRTTSSQEWAAITATSTRTDGELWFWCFVWVHLSWCQLYSCFVFVFYTAGNFTAVEVTATVLRAVSGPPMWTGLMSSSTGLYQTKTTWWVLKATMKINMSK